MSVKLSKLQNQADKQESTLEIEIREVEGTPFRVIKNENGVNIIMGDQVLNKGFKEIKEAEDYIASKPWELILIAGAVYSDFINKVRREDNKCGVNKTRKENDN